jgi:aerobic carbon-monoxide dehydrogenase small subunit
MRTPTALREISLTVNGNKETVHTHPMERLLDVLRLHLGLTGAKEGCGEGECGSCSVLMNGQVVTSCLIPALQAQDATITTIEGLAGDSQLHPLQRAFLECGGAQCGICTPGFIMAAAHLLKSHTQPTADEIKEALAGNLCRCTGYAQICESVAQAVHDGHGKLTQGNTG